MKKILTLDELIKFCDENQFYSFSAKDSGYQLSVQVPAEFESQESDDETMLYCNVKLMHTGRNRNGSNLTEKAANKLVKGGFAYVPLLANFTEDEDGLPDFTSHDMTINDDGEVEYLEHQIGCFTTKKPYLEQDPKKEDRQYIFCEAVVPVEYTKAAEIITRKGTNRISAEIGVNEMKYDAKEKELLLEDVVLYGATCLGVDPYTKNEIEEGMEGARIQIEDFSKENNSVLSHFNKDQALIDILERLNTTLSNFNIDKPNAQKEEETGGESMKLNELLDKYNVTVEDLDFEYSEMTDEELEAKFAELFDGTDGGSDGPAGTDNDGSGESGETDDNDTGDDGEGDVVIDDDETAESKKIAGEYSVIPEKYSITMSDGSIKEFSLSLQDQISALCTLVNETYGESDNCWYDVIVYDKNLVMYDWWTGKAYRQDYKCRAEVFSLVGDRIPVHSIYVTDDEEKALNDMRSNFASMSEELDKYRKADEESQKEAIFASDEYVSIFEKTEYKETNIEDYSIDELKNHLDGIVLKYAKEGNLNFAVNDENPNKKLFGDPSSKTKKKGRYGNLFRKNK